MTPRWEDVEEVLVGFAADDLRELGEVEPALVGFAGANLRLIAWLRPFAKGAYHDPLTELFALAAPLDCDRLTLLLSGRVWSLDDPVAPVTDDGDLRQRVVMLHSVDGSDGPPRPSSVLWPFTLGDAGPSWGERVVLHERLVGWIGEALEMTVRCRDELHAPLAEVAAQAQRVVRLGHRLYLPADVTLLIAEAASRARS